MRSFNRSCFRGANVPLWPVTANTPTSALTGRRPRIQTPGLGTRYAFPDRRSRSRHASSTAGHCCGGLGGIAMRPARPGQGANCSCAGSSSR